MQYKPRMSFIKKKDIYLTNLNSDVTESHFEQECQCTRRLPYKITVSRVDLVLIFLQKTMPMLRTTVKKKLNTVNLCPTITGSLVTVQTIPWRAEAHKATKGVVTVVLAVLRYGTFIHI